MPSFRDTLVIAVLYLVELVLLPLKRYSVAYYAFFRFYFVVQFCAASAWLFSRCSWVGLEGKLGLWSAGLRLTYTNEGTPKKIHVSIFRVISLVERYIGCSR